MFRLAQKENLIIPAHIDYLASLRDFITQIGKKYHFSHKFINTFKLAVDEAATNIIKHAYSETEGYITVQALVKSNSLTLKILDQGSYFDPKWAKDLDLKESVNTDEKMGLGIFMMRKLMDEVDYKKSTSGNELTLTKKDKQKKGKLQLFNLSDLPTALKIRYLIHALIFVTILNGAGYYYYHSNASSEVEAKFIESGKKLSNQVTHQLCAITPNLLNGPDGLSYVKAIILPVYDENLGRIYSLSLEDSLGFIAWSTIPTELNSSFKRPDLYYNYDENIFNYSIGSENEVYEFESELEFQTGAALYKKLHVLVSSNYLMHEIKKQRITYLKYTLISLGLCFIIIAFISYLVSHPIHKLTKWVRAASTGNLQDEMDIDATTEIGEIAQAFTDITTKFNQSQKHLADREGYEKEINLAKDIQHSLLPRDIPEIETLDICAFYEAAKTVGGDFYDFIEVDQEHIGIAIADVSGKGVPGSLMMTIIRTAMRTEARGSNDAAEVLTRVNDFVVNDMKHGMFATIFYLIINTKTLVINFASAGHNPLILHSRSKKSSYNLNPNGFPVGIKLPVADYFAQNIKSETIQLAQDEFILLYTDGITEAMNPKKQLFGEERLTKIISKSTSLTLKNFTEKLKNNIYSFTEDGPLHDDITFIAIKPKKKTTNDIEYDPSLSVNVNFLSIDDSNKIIDIVRSAPNLGAEEVSQKLNTKEYGNLELDPERVLSELSRRQLHTVALRLKYVESKEKGPLGYNKVGRSKIIPPIFEDSPTYTLKEKEIEPPEDSFPVNLIPDEKFIETDSSKKNTSAEESGSVLQDFIDVLQPETSHIEETQPDETTSSEASTKTELDGSADNIADGDVDEIEVKTEQEEKTEQEDLDFKAEEKMDLAAEESEASKGPEATESEQLVSRDDPKESEEFTFGDISDETKEQKTDESITDAELPEGEIIEDTTLLETVIDEPREKDVEPKTISDVADDSYQDKPDASIDSEEQSDELVLPEDKEPLNQDESPEATQEEAVKIDTEATEVTVLEDSSQIEISESSTDDYPEAPAVSEDKIEANNVSEQTLSVEETEAHEEPTEIADEVEISETLEIETEETSKVVEPDKKVAEEISDPVEAIQPEATAHPVEPEDITKTETEDSEEEAAQTETINTTKDIEVEETELSVPEAREEELSADDISVEKTIQPEEDIDETVVTESAKIEHVSETIENTKTVEVSEESLAVEENITESSEDTGSLDVYEQSEATGKIEDARDAEPHISPVELSGSGALDTPETETPNVEATEPDPSEAAEAEEDNFEFDISGNEDISDLLVDSIFDRFLSEALSEDTSQTSPEIETSSEIEVSGAGSTDEVESSEPVIEGPSEESASAGKGTSREEVTSEASGQTETPATISEIRAEEEISAEDESEIELTKATEPETVSLETKPDEATETIEIADEAEDKTSDSKPEEQELEPEEETKTTSIKLKPFVAPSETSETSLEYEFVLGNAAEFIGFEINEDREFEDYYDLSSYTDVEFRREIELEEYELVLDIRTDEEDALEEEAIEDEPESASSEVIEEAIESESIEIQAEFKEEAQTPNIEETAHETIDTNDESETELEAEEVTTSEVDHDEPEIGTLQTEELSTEELADNDFADAILGDAINFGEMEAILSDESISEVPDEEGTFVENEAQTDSSSQTITEEAETSDVQQSEDAPPQTELTDDFGLELFADPDSFGEGTFAQDLAEFEETGEQSLQPPEESQPDDIIGRPFSALQTNEYEDLYRTKFIQLRKTQPTAPEDNTEKIVETSQEDEPKTEALRVKSKIIEEPISDEVSLEQTVTTETAPPLAETEKDEEQEVDIQYLESSADIYTEEPPAKPVTSEEEETLEDNSDEILTADVEDDLILTGNVVDETLSVANQATELLPDTEAVTTTSDDEDAPVITEEISFQTPAQTFPETPFISLKTNELEDKYSKDIELKQAKALNEGITETPNLQQEAPEEALKQPKETEIKKPQENFPSATDHTSESDPEIADTEILHEKTQTTKQVEEIPEPETVVPEPAQLPELKSVSEAKLEQTDKESAKPEPEITETEILHEVTPTTTETVEEITEPETPATDPDQVPELESLSEAETELEQEIPRHDSEPKPKPEIEQIVTGQPTQAKDEKDELSEYLMTGVKHYKNKQYEDAIIFLKKVIKLDPNVTEAFAMLGNAYYRNGMLYEAIMAYEQLKPNNMKDPSIYENLGLIYWKLNQRNKAVDAWQKVLKLSPDRTDIKKRIAFLQQNGTQEIKTQIRKISLKQNGTAKTNVDENAHQDILKKAMEQYRSQDYISAIDSLKLALKHFPDNEEIYTYLANAYFRNKMFDNAVEIYEHLIKLDENNTTVLENLGMLHLKQGAFKQAVAEWKKIIVRQPGRADLMQKIAKVSALIEGN